MLDSYPAGGSAWSAADIIDVYACESIDLETCLIRRALNAPPPVVCGFYFHGEQPHLQGLWQMEAHLRRLLEDRRRLIVGHNVAFDFCVILEWFPNLRELVFQAYDDDRVLDTGLAQRIIEIETGDKRGSLGLAQLCARYGFVCEKTAERLDFGRFLGCHADDLPEGHRRYALGDPEQTWLLFRRLIERNLVKRRDLAELARNDLALKLTAAFGLMTDQARVEALDKSTRARLAELQGIMLDEKLMRWERNKPMPVKNMATIKRLAADAYGIPVDEKGRYIGDPSWIEELQNEGLLTDGGKTGIVSMSTSSLVLEESGSPILESLCDYGQNAAVWNKDLVLFRTAWWLPMHTRFGFAATLRSTSGGGFNQQNLRKKEGIRECIVSQFGGLVASDYEGLENSTLAEVIVQKLGRRGMADKINAGHNFHAEVGGYICGLSYDEMIRLRALEDPIACQAYNAAKPLNFGLPGFMSRAATVAMYARIGYGVNLPVERWQELMDLWYETQHDQVAYLREYVDSLKVGSGRGSLYNVPIPGTGIIRRGATRTAAANTGFQGLGGRVALMALYLVCREQMLGRMPGKCCAFIHDEIISDAKEDDVEQCRLMQEKWMGVAAEKLLTHVRLKIKSVAMRHWSKKAKTVTDGAGRLVLDLTH
jgi:hypothetical protein